jgi:hypothetical protein
MYILAGIALEILEERVLPRVVSPRATRGRPAAATKAPRQCSPLAAVAAHLRVVAATCSGAQQGSRLQPPSSSPPSPFLLSDLALLHGGRRLE